MGKHSNIIFCKEDGTIIDSIKHVSASMSSVREVLPGREYFIPQTIAKENPLTITGTVFRSCILSSPTSVQKALYGHLTGISPIVAEELCHLASIDSDRSAGELTDPELTHLYHTFQLMMEDVKEGRFSPAVVYDGDTPVEYASVPLTCYEGKGYRRETFESISTLLENYYASRDTITRIRQKSSDLRRIVQTALERSCKKIRPAVKAVKRYRKA